MNRRSPMFIAQAREEYGFNPVVEPVPGDWSDVGAIAKALGCDAEQITTATPYVVSHDIILTITGGTYGADVDVIATQFDVDPGQVSLATERQANDRLGWEGDTVPPFCHDRPVATLIDQRLLEYERVWAAAGTSSNAFAIDPEELTRLTNATVCPVGREP